MPSINLIAGLLLVSASSVAESVESSCYGTAEAGRLEGGVSFPFAGRNFSSYSAIGWLAGRMYLHSRVLSVVTSSFRVLEESAVGKVYVIGETGTGVGGRFPPHRTHQNGTSVDFMVPVLLNGKSVPLPTSATNQFGYGIEFDDSGRWGRYRIDFEALGEHLFQLDAASRKEGIRISRVILEVPLQRLLWKSNRGDYLRQNVVFSTKRAWVRHDEHYHVDFKVKCKA